MKVYFIVLTTYSFIEKMMYKIFKRFDENEQYKTKNLNIE